MLNWRRENIISCLKLDAGPFSEISSFWHNCLLLSSMLLGRSNSSFIPWHQVGTCITRNHGKLCITKLQTGHNIWLPGQYLGFGHIPVWSNPTDFISSHASYLELHIHGEENGQYHCWKSLDISLDVTLETVLKPEVHFRIYPCDSYFTTTTQESEIYESWRGDGNSWQLWAKRGYFCLHSIDK